MPTFGARTLDTELITEYNTVIATAQLVKKRIIRVCK